MRSVTLMHRIEYAAFRFGMTLLALLPESVAVAKGGAIGWFAGSVFRIRRRVVDEHLALAFPQRSPQWRSRVARASYRHLGQEAVTLFRLGGLTGPDIAGRTRVVGFEAVRAAAGAGGVVAVTGHLGNWEMAGAAVAAHGIPIDAVTKEMANPLFDAALTRARLRIGMNVVDMMAAPKAVLKNLRQGGRLQALLIDQNAHRGGVFVPFFGKDAATVRGPALFALRSGAPVFLATALRNPGWKSTYTVTFTPVDFEPSGELDKDVHDFTARLTSALEAAVRSAPEQYFWHHKRWKKRPEGEEPPTSG